MHTWGQLHQSANDECFWTAEKPHMHRRTSTNGPTFCYLTTQIISGYKLCLVCKSKRSLLWLLRSNKEPLDVAIRPQIRAKLSTLSLAGPMGLKQIKGLDVNHVTLPRQSKASSSLFAVPTAPQLSDAERMFITRSMHIHVQVDGARGGMCITSRCGAECRSRRRMLIQLYGSCSSVPMATVFALEQKSCIRSHAIKRPVPGTRTGDCQEPKPSTVF